MSNTYLKLILLKNPFFEGCKIRINVETKNKNLTTNSTEVIGFFKKLTTNH